MKCRIAVLRLPHSSHRAPLWQFFKYSVSLTIFPEKGHLVFIRIQTISCINHRGIVILKKYISNQSIPASKNLPTAKGIYYIPRLTASSRSSTLSASFFICFRFRLRTLSASRNSSASCRILASCSASLLPMPGSTLMRYSICCSFIIKSLASSLCRWANVFGESGRGGRSLF